MTYRSIFFILVLFLIPTSFSASSANSDDIPFRFGIENEYRPQFLPEKFSDIDESKRLYIFEGREIHRQLNANFFEIFRRFNIYFSQFERKIKKIDLTGKWKGHTDEQDVGFIVDPFGMVYLFGTVSTVDAWQSEGYDTISGLATELKPLQTYTFRTLVDSKDQSGEKLFGVLSIKDSSLIFDPGSQNPNGPVENVILNGITYKALDGLAAFKYYLSAE